MQSSKLSFAEQAIADRDRHHQRRSLQPIVPTGTVEVWRAGQQLLNFSANDYLGLSKHPALIAAAQQATAAYGTSATASRLVTGTYDLHATLEQNLATYVSREAALLFNTGFQANSTVLAALLTPQSLVLCDRYSHSSLIQGVLASRATFKRYRHNDCTHLEKLLQQAAPKNYDRIWIVTESVFSMDGDRSDLSPLIALALQHDALVYVDDAHAIGVLGEKGQGLAAAHPEIDVVVGTFGKAFGSFGAFVACSSLLREYLLNCCPGFIYTTALPPSVVGTIAAALELMPTLEKERQSLQHSAADLRDRLHQLGFATAQSSSQIVPIVVGNEEKTLSLSKYLEQQGILATAIRPPTVPPGTARIRLALSSAHTPAHFQQLLHALEQWQERDQP